MKASDTDPGAAGGAATALRPHARRALGVDPGTARLGYAVVEEYRSRLTLIACGCIETPKTLAMPQRLLQLYNDLSAIVQQHQPREMAVEELFFAKNTTTVSEYKPMHVKQAVHGYGLASKDQVGEMVKVLLGLPSVPKPDDAADAAAIAICHLH